MSRSKTSFLSIAGGAFLMTFAVAQEASVDELTSEQRCQALCDAQDRGGLTVVQAFSALAGNDEAVARTAAAIVRHEWVALPDELFIALASDARAAKRFLEELVRGPRPAAREWVVRQAAERSKRTYDHRLLALAARGEPLTQREAELLLEAVQAEESGDGFYFAAAHVSEKAADLLLGRMHQLLLAGNASPEQLGPLLDRLSPRGARILIGLAVTLPDATARKLLQRVHDQRPKLVQERAAAVLDGLVPLDSVWLEFANKLLDGPERRERIDRVLKLFVDGEVEVDRNRAFEAMLRAGVMDPQLLQAVIASGSDQQIRRTIRSAADKLPADIIVAWLQGSPEVAQAMSMALTRRKVLEPEIQAQLLATLRGLDAAEGFVPLAALTALVRGGDQQALAKIWPLALANRAWSELLHQLGQRQEPFVYQALLAELVAGSKRQPDPDPAIETRRQSQLDMLRLLLVARGDRRELDTLVANAPKRKAVFVRRCGHYADKLTARHAQSLFDAALACEDEEVAAELLEWVVTAQPQAMSERLWKFWRDPPDVPAVEELCEVAMCLLTTSTRRSALLDEMREAFGKGPLPDRLTSLPYEALNSMTEPLDEGDVQLCADLLLVMPLADAAGEQRRASRWPDGTFGFPLVAAVANRLRKADVALCERVFAAAIEQLVGNPNVSGVSRQRLKVFWRSLAMRPDLQHALGSITAQIWTVVDPRDEVSDGPAIYYQAVRAERLGQFAVAERLYRRAGRELLRLPSRRGEARWLLGDRDTTRGDDPLAALAAAPYVMRLLAARAATSGVAFDEAAIANAVELIREFAGRDLHTLETLTATPKESGR